jgi:wyosine [tRNA(Phe)-imidazoG37] synthetase (radical SAM superfamily)
MSSVLFENIIFGPVPSRRLGRSLGINNIPPKICTYACMYCQVGHTTKMTIDRMSCYEPDNILEDVRVRTEQVRESGDTIDYLTFVPDGEPCLDINLGREIVSLGQTTGMRTAVITNASLIWREDVREELMKADWVSVKVDSIYENRWRKVNRPHPGLQLEKILDGIIEFSEAYPGKLMTETMLLKDLNDGEMELEALARYLALVKPATAYIAIPIRPPVEAKIQAPDESSINRCFQIFSRYLDHVECLVGYEGNAFSSTGNAEEDIISITAVHPMREDAVRSLLKRSNASWEMILRLISEGKLTEIEYGGNRYYLRKFDT